MKIFRSDQIRKIDELTIKTEPVSSVDLMERAAGQLFKWFINQFTREGRVLIFVGPGNNGGDGLALARMLSADRFSVEVFCPIVSDTRSDDWNHNYTRFKNEAGGAFFYIDAEEQFPLVASCDIVVDAIFGSGLTRPVSGLVSDVIKKINRLDCTVVSVDIPSGLFGEDNSGNDTESIIEADITLCFEFPKLSFMFPENSKFVGEWHVLPIGLSSEAVRTVDTPYFLTGDAYISSLLEKREKFDHKGKFGHGLLVGGSFGKMGAAVLGARAAMRTGIGLLTCHVPECGYQIIQTAVPEAMAAVDKNDKVISEIDVRSIYSALAIGPGLGTDTQSQRAFHTFLLNRDKPMVIDADGINILGMNSKWLSAIPENAVLTPHIREFERIAGISGSAYSRLGKQVEFSAEHNCIVLLKGAYTSITTPEGSVFFNGSGNPGMATGGSGDVLTGMVLALLSRSYPPSVAAVAGAYIHGLAGDMAAVKTGYESLTASDIIENIPGAFNKLENIGWV